MILILMLGGIALAFLDMARSQSRIMEEIYLRRSVAAQRLAVDAGHLIALTADLPTVASEAERQTILQRIDFIKGTLTADIDMLRAAGLTENDLSVIVQNEQALFAGADLQNELIRKSTDLRRELDRQRDLARRGCQKPPLGSQCQLLLWALSEPSGTLYPTESQPGLEAVLSVQRDLFANEQRRLNLARRQSEIVSRLLFVASSQSDDASRETIGQQSKMAAWAMRIEWGLAVTMLLSLILVLAVRRLFKRRVVRRMRALETTMVHWRENMDWSAGCQDQEDHRFDEIDAMSVALADLLHEVNKRSAELQRSNSELEQFAYVASHDLRQPLRMVSSYLKLIERHLGPQLEGELREFFNFAVNGANRMDRLILDLLDYSRIGRQGTGFEPVPLAEAANEALLNLSAAIDEAAVDVVIDPQLPVVQGNRSELLRLLQNLIGNAVKYRAQGRLPKVEVGYEERDGQWLIWVQDNGVGIRSDDFDRAFGVFQRLVRADEFEGTGIGLAICKKIVEQHGGRIWIESTLNVGSRFFFTLPKA